MCSYVTERVRLEGAAKGAQGWFDVTDASVYVDHPNFRPEEHTLNIDFCNDAGGAGARVAVELTPKSARALVASIETALRRYSRSG